MLLLILADRDKIGLIDQNVRRHQHRIGEETRGDVVGVLLRFHLELRHAAQLAELCVAAEHPGKLCVGGHVRLDEHDVLLRIESAGNILRQLLEAAATKVGRNLPDRDCVHIDDAVDAVIFVLKGDPVFDRAHIGAKRQIAARLNTGKNAFFRVHGETLFIFFIVDPMKIHRYWYCTTVSCFSQSVIS